MVKTFDEFSKMEIRPKLLPSCRLLLDFRPPGLFNDDLKTTDCDVSHLTMIYEHGCSIKSLYIGLRCNDLTNDAYDVFRHKLLDGSFFDSFMNRDDWAERFRMTTDVWNADLVEMRAKLRDTGAAWVRIIPMFAEYYNINIVVRFTGQQCGDQSEHTYSCAPENSLRFDFTVTQNHIEFIPASPLQDQCKQLYEELQKCEDMEQESIMMSQMFQLIELDSDSDSDSLDLSYICAAQLQPLPSVVG